MSNATPTTQDNAGRDWRWYMQRPVIVIFFLGFSGGLPFPLVYTTMSLWLETAEVVRSTISTFAWLGFAYSFKFLWSPLVDAMSLPVLTRLLGRRRAWLLFSQVGLAVTIFAISYLNPAMELAVFVWLAVAIAVLSATQDIVIDAYRIESAEQEMQSVLAAAYQYGYRLGVLMAGAGALYVAEFASWTISYQTMAAFMCIGIVTTLLCHEPDVGVRVASKLTGGVFRKGGQWLGVAVVEPFVDFTRRYRADGIVILAFVSSFWISDRVLGILAYPFYYDVGFTLTQIATVSKVYGVIVALLGAAGGAAAVLRFGLRRCIVVATVFLTATNLMFAIMTVTGPKIEMLTLVISFDNFAQGFGATVMVTYMSSLINLNFTATQYALISSIGTFIGKFTAGYSGDVQLAIGWYNFFLYAAATGLPAVLLSLVVASRMKEEE